MGVCCIVVDIDGMLFEFFMNFLNIEKNIYIYFFSIFKVFFAFHAISNIKKNWCKKKIRWILKSAPSLCPLFPCFDFVSQMWGWFGGGV